MSEYMVGDRGLSRWYLGMFVMLHERGGNFLVGGFEFEEDRTQAVVAAGDGHSGLAYPVVEVELLRAVGEGEHVLVDGSPRSIAETVGLAQTGIEHLPLFQGGTGLEAGHTIFLHKVFLECSLEYCNLYFFHSCSVLWELFEINVVQEVSWMCPNRNVVWRFCV